VLRLLLCAALLCCAGAAQAEKADRDKPINITADTGTFNDAKQIATFIGNVVVTQGTLTIRGDKMVVTQGKDGFKHGTIWGKPATFREKREGVDEYVNGSALRIEYDDKTDVVELFDNAMVKRNKDEVRGSYISYNGNTDFYKVLGSGTPDATPANPTGRVHAVIQPKSKEQKNQKPAAKPALPLQSTPGIHPLGGSDAGTGH
jgi:lipopolysaccharide export system protein LptA